MSGEPGAVRGATIQVTQGRVTGFQGIRFGGIAQVPANERAPARIRIAVRHGADELTADLCEGDILQIPCHTGQPGHSWQLRHINSTGRTWDANLTCIA